MYRTTIIHTLTRITPPSIHTAISRLPLHHALHTLKPSSHHPSHINSSALTHCIVNTALQRRYQHTDSDDMSSTLTAASVHDTNGKAAADADAAANAAVV